MLNVDLDDIRFCNGTNGVVKNNGSEQKKISTNDRIHLPSL